jgi:hypothetical protein
MAWWAEIGRGPREGRAAGLGQLGQKGWIGAGSECQRELGRRGKKKRKKGGLGRILKKNRKLFLNFGS